MKLITGLFRFARKRIQTTDADMGEFRNKLSELVTNCNNLKDEEVSEKVEELKGFITDLPESEDKEKLSRFLEDFKSVKEQDTATAKEAANMVADLFEKLDTKAMEEVPVAKEEAAEEPAEEATTGSAEETVEETTASNSEEKTVEDTDEKNADYEEIYQYIKKRMAEDSESTKDTDEIEEGQEEKENEVVTDHAPHIPVTMNNKAVSGSLADMFNKIKEGGR